MSWKVEDKLTEDEWTREAFIASTESHLTHTPPKWFKLGNVDISWWETTPGVAFIYTKGGTPDDRTLAEGYAREWLRNAGYQQAKYTLYRKQKVATWDDIMAKAQRLIQSGNVQLLRNGAQNIVGHVVGDHGDYQTEISRENPDDQTITQWQCDCPWDQYAWQRTRQWKKYEGRPCAHVLATYWESQRTPLDEEYDGQGSGTLFDPGTATPPPPGSISGTPPVSPGPVPQLSIPGVSTPPPAPPAPEVIPPLPGQPAPPGIVSVPGARVPTPADPIQHPGGTFSKVADWNFNQDEGTGDGWKFVYSTRDGKGFANSDMVRLEEEEYGVMEGKSEEHGAGQPKLIPKGSIGEVLGEDPTTGWVDVAFAGPQAGAGPLEPYHVRCYVEPAKLTPMPNVKKPGPFIRRR